MDIKFILDNILPYILLAIKLLLLVVAFIPLIQRKNYKWFSSVLITVSLIYSILYTTKLYINRSDNILIWTGIILYCYGSFSSFISTINANKFMNVFTSVLFLIGSLLFLYDSIRINENLLKNYKFISSIFSLFGSICFILSTFLKIPYMVRIGWVFYIIGMVISL